MRKTTVASMLLVAACSGADRTPPPAGLETAAAPPASAAPAQPPLTYGQHHHPIRASNPEAQKMFDQGMAQAYGFNHEAAIRSFERASELDPRAPMPHWGRAWALGPNYNMDIDDPRAKAAYDAITKARSLALEQDVERAYIDALAVRYSPDMKADRAALARAYSRAMGELSRGHPDDLDAAALYAESLMNLTPWKLWTLDGKPNTNTEEIVRILESVLQRSPNHLGANHYYIHAVEASGAPGRALPSAARLAALAEQSGHLLHMPAHIYARTGDHAGAANANAAGAAADRRYLVTDPNGLYGMMYYSHNLHFLADSHMMQGRFADALQAGNQVAEHLGPHAAMMPMVESMIVTPLNVFMRFGRHDEILALSEPPADRPVQRAWRRFARGVALARLGRVDEASAERTALGNAMTAVPEAALFGGSGLTSARSVLDVAALVLDARIAAARSHRELAITLWQKAVAAADTLPYDEPPIWFYPIRESLGAALLVVGRPADAERVFREDLVRHPRNARALFGLHDALVQQGKTADAAWVKREFEQAWKNADTTLALGDL